MTSSSSIPQPKEERTQSTMMAWRVHRFGPPEAMTLEDVARREPGPAEVLRNVEPAGVAPWERWIRAGKSTSAKPLRLALGSDWSGEVVAVGSGVSGLHV